MFSEGGNLHARSFAVKDPTVVAASKVVALTTSERKWRESVRAAIEKDSQLVRRIAVGDVGFAEEDKRMRCTRHLVGATKWVPRLEKCGVKIAQATSHVPKLSRGLNSLGQPVDAERSWLMVRGAA